MVLIRTLQSYKEDSIGGRSIPKCVYNKFLKGRLGEISGAIVDRDGLRSIISHVRG